jgi:hypothetical protein
VESVDSFLFIVKNRHSAGAVEVNISQILRSEAYEYISHLHI